MYNSRPQRRPAAVETADAREKEVAKNPHTANRRRQAEHPPSAPPRPRHTATTPPPQWPWGRIRRYACTPAPHRGRTGGRGQRRWSIPVLRIPGCFPLPLATLIALCRRCRPPPLLPSPVSRARGPTTEARCPCRRAMRSTASPTSLQRTCAESSTTPSSGRTPGSSLLFSSVVALLFSPFLSAGALWVTAALFRQPWALYCRLLSLLSFSFFLSHSSQR